MIILSKLADYGVIVATHLAAHPDRQANAAAIAAATRLPQATVAKLLKALAHAGLVTATRGAAGGYRLARRPPAISVAEVVAAIDGDIGITECSVHEADCERTTYCPTRPHWGAINRAVGAALSAISLQDMVSPFAFAPRCRPWPEPANTRNTAFDGRPMSASLTTQQTIRTLSQEGYKYGFVTDIEADSAPPGLDEDTVRFISAKKGEPEWLLEWRLASFRHWQGMIEPDWAKLNIAPIDYQAHTYYSAPKQNDGPKSLDEVDPELLATYEKLGIPLREREALAGVQEPGRCRRRGRRRVRQRLGRDDLQGAAGRTRHHLLLVRRGGARAPRAGAQISRHRRAAERQFLRGPQLGRVQRRVVRLHPARRALPDGAVAPISASTRATAASSSAPC